MGMAMSEPQRITKPASIVGFTLIELMIVIAIVGILSSIALPIFRDHMVRTRVEELIVATTAVKSSIAEYAQIFSTLTGSGGSLTVATGGNYVSDANVGGNGIITVTGTTATLDSTNDVVLTLTPLIQPDDVVQWTCSGLSANEGYLPASCRN